MGDYNLILLRYDPATPYKRKPHSKNIYKLYEFIIKAEVLGVIVQLASSTLCNKTLYRLTYHVSFYLETTKADILAFNCLNSYKSLHRNYKV